MNAGHLLARDCLGTESSAQTRTAAPHACFNLNHVIDVHDCLCLLEPIWQRALTLATTFNVRRHACIACITADIAHPWCAGLQPAQGSRKTKATSPSNATGSHSAQQLQQVPVLLPRACAHVHT